MSQPLPFGKYLLLDRINVGGMAEVFKAKSFGIEGFERILAIKRILPNMADDDEFINMFIDEARIAVQLSHPNVVSIYELGKFDNQFYIAMEYVAGKDLRQILDRYRKRETLMPLGMAALIATKICAGLDYAHKKTDAHGKQMGLIHRDVSPQNILVGYEGAVKITDFGIVKAEDRASKTQAGVLKGKFGYMSPEQVRGLEIDQRSDIFALGILLYEMLTGKRLFVGDSDFATLERVRAAEVQPPQTHNPQISDGLAAAALKALARDRDDRFATAKDLRDALMPFVVEADGASFTEEALSAAMHELYAEDIVREQARLEESLRTPAANAPRDEALANEHLAAPQSGWNGEARGEKTVIFESGADLSGAPSIPKLAGPPDLGREHAERPTLAFDGIDDPQLQALHLAPPQSGSDARPEPSPAPRPKWRTPALIVAGMLGVALAGQCFWYLRRAPEGQALGSIVVSVEPVRKVSIFLDDKLVGDKSPMTQREVKPGLHSLRAQAPGFRDGIFSFDLAPGAPAEIPVKLEPIAPALADGQLEISSEPDMASVRMGGLPQGVTPLVLNNSDTAHAIVLEIGKPGYVTQTLTVSFKPDERHKECHVKLVAVGAPPDPTSPTVDARAHLVVRSRPSRSVVYVAGAERGVTPLVIDNLDPNARYALEVSHPGFRPYTMTVEMGGRQNVAAFASLIPARVAPRRALPPEQLACGGTGAKLSLMSLDVPDCKVTVGRTALGVMPMFKKDAPVGRCVIDVVCPGNKHFRTTRVLKNNVEEKIIIKPDDWQT